MTAVSAEAIAVVGMACRLPGAADTRRYWSALRAGFDGITRRTPDDLVAAGVDPALVKRPDFVPAVGMLAGAHEFDWRHFGYSRAEAAGIDPQQRVFLECAATALDDAAIDPARFPGWIGVYAGADQVIAGPDPATGSLAQAVGREKDFLTSRVAYRLNLRGPAITVQTACSTSLTAVHLASQALLGYECDAALAGGVTVGGRGEHGYLYEEGGIYSPDGHCRPFDRDAAGTVPGEGVGVVVLKRLTDALEDGDRIAAVLLGSALNNDGSDKIGFAAPSVSGQRELIRYTQRVAGVEATEIDYVEAHGTGTRLGDPVELRALADVFGEADPEPGWCRLGAVKGSIGHTGAAAGVAGLIKTALMLEHRELVPTANYRSPNPLLGLEKTPFQICTRNERWPERGEPTAAVSAFGAGGANAHVILRAAPERVRPAADTGPRILALSASSPGALGRLRGDLAGHLGTAALAESFPGLAGVCRTLADRRRLSHRQSFVVGDLSEAARLLDAAADPTAPTAPTAPGTLERTAFLLPGQGTLRHAAGAAAHRILPEFRAAFDEIAEAVQERRGPDLTSVIDPRDTPDGWFADTVNQQLGLFALGYGLGRQLLAWAVRPAAMLGNSVGEYAAAALAGVWTPQDAAALVHERAAAMRDTAPGRMAVVDAGPDEVLPRIEPWPDVEIAVVGPAWIVVSGPPEQMRQLLDGDALAGLVVRPVHTTRAFHSAAMDPAAAAVRHAAAQISAAAPNLPFVSTVTGDWAGTGAADIEDPGYWAEQLRRPVQLDTGLGTVLRAGCDTFIELGPGASMIEAARGHRDWHADAIAVALLGRSSESPERGLLRAIGTLWEHGADIDPDSFPASDPASERPLRCSIPARTLDSQDPNRSPNPHEEPGSPPLSRSAVQIPSSSRTSLERLWCESLGVDRVTDEDDFLAFGGDSLALLGLIHQVSALHSRALSPTDFLREPTFGRLVRLAESSRPDEVPGVVSLEPHGRGRPVFLAADAFGTTAGLRLLAGALDADRPVLGLEPAGGPPMRRGRRIEDVAADYAEAIVRIQPSGSYTVGGWSYGAIVAHETARLLESQGRTVDLVVCLDGFVAGARRAHRPLGADPGHLVSALRLMADATLGSGLVGRHVRRAPALRRVVVGNLSAMLRYRPHPIAAQALLVPAGSSTVDTAGLARRLAGEYGGITTLAATGDHWSMLLPPHVHTLARDIHSVLAEVHNG